ncbi:MAG: hypothetical protein JO307_30990 [Bryobacterales bacterium]|nr:hypothetical protein [Bryobacterales bacterium]
MKFNPLATKRLVAVGALGAVVVAMGYASNAALSRFVRAKIIRSLQDDFGSELEIQKIDVRVFPRLQVTGEGLALFYRRRDLPPLISVARFSAESNLLSALAGHIARARLEGLEIQIPPKSQRAGVENKKAGLAGFSLDEIVADGSILKIFPSKPDKEPLEWDIRRLTLHGARATAPMSFNAVLTNPEPPGDIQSNGKFGPWQTNEPGDTPIEGGYTLANADLSVFGGISGRLSSKGAYRGVLSRIEVEGATDTPDFAVKISGNPAHLTTRFQAVVDGTNGDTTLNPVYAQFSKSALIARGGVTSGGKGKGKTIALNVSVEKGRLEDMLRLGVQGSDPFMTGAVAFDTKLVIPPGEIDITKKLQLDGAFKVASAQFSQTSVQENVNKLSHRGKGEPEEPPDANVASNFSGSFSLRNGAMKFQNLSFHVPGVNVALHGTYGLMDQTIDFHGTATLDAKLSQTTTGVKSFLLKAVDPFFKKKSAGAVIRIKVTGNRSQPKYGLDL